MAFYRLVRISFWTDTKVVDDFTPEDRYFYIYLLTNPYTNLCGCYELSTRRASEEMGYNQDAIGKLIERMRGVHRVIDYDKTTKEVLLINWCKNNWTKSEKYLKPVGREINDVKNPSFKEYLMANLQQICSSASVKDTIWIPYRYPMDTTNTISITNTNTISNSNSIPITNSDSEDNSGFVGKKEKQKAGGEKVNVYYESIPLNKAFTDYVAMRKKIKKPLTDRALRMAQTKLETLATGENGFDEEIAIEILGESTFHDWAGLYPPKDDGRRQRGTTRGAIDWDSA